MIKSNLTPISKQSQNLQQSKLQKMQNYLSKNKEGVKYNIEHSKKLVVTQQKKCKENNLKQNQQQYLIPRINVLDQKDQNSTKLKNNLQTRSAIQNKYELINQQKVQDKLFQQLSSNVKKDVNSHYEMYLQKQQRDTQKLNFSYSHNNSVGEGKMLTKVYDKKDFDRKKLQQNNLQTGSSQRKNVPLPLHPNLHCKKIKKNKRNITSSNNILAQESTFQTHLSQDELFKRDDSHLMSFKKDRIGLISRSPSHETYSSFNQPIQNKTGKYEDQKIEQFERNQYYKNILHNSKKVNENVLKNKYELTQTGRFKLETKYSYQNTKLQEEDDYDQKNTDQILFEFRQLLKQKEIEIENLKKQQQHSQSQLYQHEQKNIQQNDYLGILTDEKINQKKDNKVDKIFQENYFPQKQEQAKLIFSATQTKSEFKTKIEEKEIKAGSPFKDLSSIQQNKNLQLIQNIEIKNSNEKINENVSTNEKMQINYQQQQDEILSQQESRTQTISQLFQNGEEAVFCKHFKMACEAQQFLTEIQEICHFKEEDQNSNRISLSQSTRIAEHLFKSNNKMKFKITPAEELNNNLVIYFLHYLNKETMYRVYFKNIVRIIEFIPHLSYIDNNNCSNTHFVLLQYNKFGSTEEGEFLILFYYNDDKLLVTISQKEFYQQLFSLVQKSSNFQHDFSIVTLEKTIEYLQSQRQDQLFMKQQLGQSQRCNLQSQSQSFFSNCSSMQQDNKFLQANNNNNSGNQSALILSSNGYQTNNKVDFNYSQSTILHQSNNNNNKKEILHIQDRTNKQHPTQSFGNINMETQQDLFVLQSQKQLLSNGNFANFNEEVQKQQQGGQTSERKKQISKIDEEQMSNSLKSVSLISNSDRLLQAIKKDFEESNYIKECDQSKQKSFNEISIINEQNSNKKQQNQDITNHDIKKYLNYKNQAPPQINIQIPNEDQLMQEFEEIQKQKQGKVISQQQQNDVIKQTSINENQQDQSHIRQENSQQNYVGQENADMRKQLKHIKSQQFTPPTNVLYFF